MRGIINRTKVRIKGGGSDGAGYELTEITATATVNSSGIEEPLTLAQFQSQAQSQPQPPSPSTPPPPPAHSTSASTSASTSQSQSLLFFCDSREPKPLADTSRESMQTGDEIEFIGIPALNVAVAAALQPKKKIESGVRIFIFY
jgi:hypothetical protein